MRLELNSGIRIALRARTARTRLFKFCIIAIQNQTVKLKSNAIRTCSVMRFIWVLRIALRFLLQPDSVLMERLHHHGKNARMYCRIWEVEIAMRLSKYIRIALRFQRNSNIRQYILLEEAFPWWSVAQSCNRNAISALSLYYSAI